MAGDNSLKTKNGNSVAKHVCSRFAGGWWEFVTVTRSETFMNNHERALEWLVAYLDIQRDRIREISE